MVIKFKKLHTVSDKVYISFDNEQTYFEFDTEVVDNSHVLFGKKGSNEEKAYIEFFKNNGEGVFSIECDATPESLEDIKIFGRDINEVWTPKYTHQRKLAYDNESPETVYINYEQNPNAFKEYLESENTNTDLKVYNIYGDQEYKGTVYRMDLADQFRDTLKESGKTLNLGSSILPPRKSYKEQFANIKNLIYGPELPDETTDAEGMYRNSSIRRPIALAGSLVSAKKIFKDSNIKSVPTEYGDALKDISYAFENCVFDNPNLSEVILGKNIENMAGSFKGSNIVLAPKVPEFITNLDAAFESCQDLEEIPNFEGNKAEKLSLQATFRSCLKLGQKSNGVAGLPSHVENMNATFTDCENLKYFDEALPEDVLYAQSTFENCKSLERAPSFNSKVENIQNIFLNCSKIKNPQNGGIGHSEGELIILPTSIKIMDGAFSGTSIERTPNMALCKSLESMEKAFFNCTSLRHVDEINRFAPLKSVMNAFDGRANIEDFPDFPFACEDDLSWKFSVGVSDKSINNSDRLKSVGSIENRVTGFLGAFKNATSLETVGQISLNNLPSIDGSFQGCTSLSVSPHIKIFGDNTSGKFLFEGCSNISKINNFPKCTTLESAFENCVKVTGKGISSYKTTLEISDSDTSPLPVKYDSDDNDLYVDVLNMFKGCSSLKEVTFPKYAINPEWICGGENSSVEIINQLPKSLLEEDKIKTLFNNFPNVKVVRKAPNVENISGWFTNNSNLVSCAFEENNEVKIMNDTFNGCINLRNTSDIFTVDDLGKRTDIEVCQLVADEDYSKFKVFIPKNAVSMIRAFKNCKQLTEIDEIPYSVEFANEAFYGCENLTKIGKILSKQGDFTNTFTGANVKEIELIKTENEFDSITLNGSGVEDTLETVGKVEGNKIPSLFENCRALKEIKELPEVISNASNTFKGCSSLESIPNKFATSDKVLVSTFENSGIKINEENYKDFFTGDIPSLTATFKGCSNVEFTPIAEHASAAIYNETFADCPNLKAVYIGKNVELQDSAFAGSNNIEKAIFISSEAKFSNTIFDDKDKLKKIENLEFNPSYSMSALSYKAETAESIVTEEGKLLDVIDSAIETSNSVIYKVFGQTEKDALTNAKIEAKKYNGKVLPVDETPTTTITVQAPVTVVEEYEEEIEETDDDGNVTTSTVTKTREKTEYVPSTATFYYRNVEITNSTFDINKKKLSEYIDWLYEEGYIYTTQYVTEENISSTVYSYFSKLGDYFPYLEEVEQISAHNSSGIFACGNVLKVNSDNVLTDEVGDIMGPTTLKRVTGKGEEGIATKEVSNLSHAFFNNTSIEYVGNIPATITGMDKPFEGCTGLKEVGNVEANVLAYTELFKDCTSLKKVGKIGKFATITSSIEKAFSGCTSLEEIGGIYGDIENFRSAFENCSSLKIIRFLSTETLKNAEKDTSNIIGMFLNTANDIVIYTEEGNASELKEILLENAYIIRNKPEKDKRGNTIYKYNFDENGIGHPYLKEECEDWVQNHVFIM